ncbi:MAG: hypothetical protein ACXWKR_03170 [Phenylobacterium sp.]
MGPFEYLLTFVSVILGLAVSDLATSLHRLLDAGRRVRWDGLAPLAGVVAFLKIVTQWWSWFSAERIARGLTFEMFLGIVVGTVLLFLLAAAALPDEVAEGPIDLKAHYAKVSSRFWLLFAGQFVVMTGVGIWAQVQIDHARFAPQTLISPAGAVFVLSLVLVFVRNRWLHGLSLAGLTILYLIQLFGHSLSA